MGTLAMQVLTSPPPTEALSRYSDRSWELRLNSSASSAGICPRVPPAASASIIAIQAAAILTPGSVCILVNPERPPLAGPLRSGRVMRLCVVLLTRRL